MATQPSYFNDGDWTNGFSPGFNPFWFPFGNNPTPDTFCRITESMLSINPICFQPAISKNLVYENLLTYSEQFDNAGWTKFDTTVAPNFFANPATGATTADALVETAVTDYHYAFQVFTVLANVSHCFSVCAAPLGSLGRNFAALQLTDSASNSYYAYFDLINGVVISFSAGTVAEIFNVGLGFFRLKITCALSAGAGDARIYISANGITPIYAGSVSSGLRLYAAQVQSLRPPVNLDGAYVATTNVARQASFPYADGRADSFAFLVDEQPMQLTDQQKANIRQTYARIPADQIYPASRVVVRPVMNDIYTGNYFAVSFDNGITSTVFSSRIATLPNSASLGTDIPPTVPVNVITSVPAKSFQALPGDTITVIDSGGATYAFTLTTVASAIQSGMATALTALTGVSARGIGNSLNITWATGTVKSVSGSSAAKISGTSTSIVFEMPDAGANVTQNTAWTYIPNVMQSLRQVNANSHGGNVGDQTVVWNGPKIICISRVVLATTNTYAIPISDLPGNDIVATHCQFAKNGTRYVNGPKECVVKKTEAYFLPGVTSGVNTFVDIPRYTPENDPIKWLAAIANANTYAVESVSDLTQWKGQILVQERNEVLMADALTTTTPGA